MNIKKILAYIIALGVIITAILYVYHERTDQSWGDAFSLGQLLVESILFPIAIASFIFATQQFLASQEFPEPHLYFETAENSFLNVIKINRIFGNNSIPTPAIALRNEGKVVTSWYLVLLNISSDIYLDSPPYRHQLNVHPHVYDPHWETTSIADGQQWRFTSQGEYALYPDYIQKLCSIGFIFSKGKKYPSICKIPYVIYSDRGKKVQGELTIEFIDN